MSDFKFLFYRDTEGSGAWHDTLEAVTSKAADAPAGTGRQVMLDPYGKARTIGDNSKNKINAEAVRESAAKAECIRALTCRLVTFATDLALYGNIWQQWLSYMLIMHENPFTLACERRTVSRTSTLMKLAEQDFAMMRELFGYDFTAIEKETGTKMLSAMTDYRTPYPQATESSASKQIRMLTSRLARAADAVEFGRIVTEYYAQYGVGIYGLYRAYRVTDDRGQFCITPVVESEDVKFSDLIGYEAQKQTLKENTDAFVRGLPANNVLLYGDSGTGKSTSIHALMHDFYSRGLRLVEVSKANRIKLPQVLAEIKKRNYRFIIFLDDLSFEENESDYKELKAMLEGALETRSDRVLIYATSNRRHLIRETWRDRNDMEYQEDIHHSDTMEEKLSLASRFGVMIYYAKPDAKEYLNIVRQLTAKHEITVDDKELEDLARKWELRHGGMSGRTASQFITWLESEAARKNN